MEDVEMGMLQHTSSSSEDRLEDAERPAISEPRRLRPMRVGQVSRKGNVLRKKNQCECMIVYGNTSLAYSSYMLSMVSAGKP